MAEDWGEMGIGGLDCKTKRKEEREIRSGSKGSNFKKWPFYEFLTFLDPVGVPMESCTNIEVSSSEEDAGNESEDDKQAVQPPLKKMGSTANARKSIDSQFFDFLKDNSKSLQESLSHGHQRELDEEGHYGQTVAATLRRLSHQQRARDTILINQALNDVEFNTPYREVLGRGDCNNQRQRDYG